MSRRGSLIQLCVIKEQKGVRDIWCTDRLWTFGLKMEPFVWETSILATILYPGPYLQVMFLMIIVM